MTRFPHHTQPARTGVEVTPELLAALGSLPDPGTGRLDHPTNLAVVDIRGHHWRGRFMVAGDVLFRAGADPGLVLAYLESCRVDS